jgi:hypothetical protein
MEIASKTNVHFPPISIIVFSRKDGSKERNESGLTPNREHTPHPSLRGAFLTSEIEQTLRAEAICQIGKRRL